MINDFLAWRKAYRGPFPERKAHELKNDIKVNPDRGIYGVRVARYRKKAGLYDVYVKVERKLSTPNLSTL